MRHFKPAYGKDFIEALVTGSDMLASELEKSAGDQVSSHQNRATTLQGQIDLIRSHQSVHDRRLDFALAREAEESDGRLNKRLASYLAEKFILTYFGPRFLFSPSLEYLFLC